MIQQKQNQAILQQLTDYEDALLKIYQNLQINDHFHILLGELLRHTNSSWLVEVVVVVCIFRYFHLYLQKSIKKKRRGKKRNHRDRR